MRPMRPRPTATITARPERQTRDRVTNTRSMSWAASTTTPTVTTILTGHGTPRPSIIIRAATIATAATAAAGLVDMVVTLSRHFELDPARGRREPRHIRCLPWEYRMSPVRRPSHPRHPVDLGTAVTSTEELASLEVDSGTAAVSAEDADRSEERRVGKECRSR